PRTAWHRRADRAGRSSRRRAAPAPGRPPSIARSAAVPVSASCRVRIRRRGARAIPGSRISCVETPPQALEAAPQPALDRADRHTETLCQLLARQPIAIGEQDGATRFGFEFVETALQDPQLGAAVGTLGCRQPVEVCIRSGSALWAHRIAAPL